ncbi:MAG: helix-turn-helix domain-containing protein [Bilifractor sp.]
MLKILIVEDEILNGKNLLMRIRRILGDSSIVELATNGQDAVSMSETLKPDCIFMDVEMPVMDGLTAAAIIHKVNPDIIIICLTAYDKFNYAVSAIRSGCRDYLLKPVSDGNLRLIIHKYLKTDQNTEGNQMHETSLLASFSVWLQENFSQNVQLEDAATSVGMSPAYFSRRIKMETSHTFSEHLTAYRMKKAKEYLLHTDMPIHRISRDVGYSDAKYFTKVFRGFYGTSPGRFREKNSE